ncbi:protein odr-4-like protein [Platysternon megacephalum]|uniref:Protein odr-4-like protein n=1 Tax=Platysternon megacephalum TaxID=55544 RepID=A0A4D9DNV2_9SAUR|nr:protein odr-4-like protein [Platysternon megacephalum]
MGEMRARVRGSCRVGRNGIECLVMQEWELERKGALVVEDQMLGGYRMRRNGAGLEKCCPYIILPLCPQPCLPPLPHAQFLPFCPISCSDLGSFPVAVTQTR